MLCLPALNLIDDQFYMSRSPVSIHRRSPRPSTQRQPFQNQCPSFTAYQPLNQGHQAPRYLLPLRENHGGNERPNSMGGGRELFTQRVPHGGGDPAFASPHTTPHHTYGPAEEWAAAQAYYRNTDISPDQAVHFCCSHLQLATHTVHTKKLVPSSHDRPR